MGSIHRHAADESAWLLGLEQVLRPVPRGRQNQVRPALAGRGLLAILGHPHAIGKSWRCP